MCLDGAKCQCVCVCVGNLVLGCLVVCLQPKKEGPLCTMNRVWLFLCMHLWGWTVNLLAWEGPRGPKCQRVL